MTQASLRRRAITGVIWAGIGQFGSQAIHYVVLLALAWFLSPADFGLLGLAMIFILFIQPVGDLGLAAALVQQKETSEPDLSTAFWANFLVSLLMAAVTYVSAETIASFLGDTSAALLLKVLSVIFPITALTVVPRALLEKDLKFQQLTLREFAGQVAFGLVGLTMAVTGAGVWSLVGAAVAQRLADAATLWVVVPWRPRPTFNLQSLRRLLDFGFYVMVAAIFAKGIANIDYFVVGRWLGIEALGYYTLAFQLAVVPQQRLMGVLRKVAFPAFSLVRDDLVRLRSGFLEGIQHLSVVLVLIGLFLAVLGPWFIEAVYGLKWLPAARPLQVLAIAGVFYGFDIAESLYFAVGQPRIRIWIIGVRLALFAIFVTTFGLSLGINGVAISLALSVAMTSFIGLLVVGRITHATWQELLKPIWPAMRAAFLTSIPIIILSFFPRFVASSWVIVFGLGIMMALIYALAVAPVYRALISRLSVDALQYMKRSSQHSSRADRL
jgi:PST family polysaccharide transporter